jgi:GntR family transcriptional regulator
LLNVWLLYWYINVLIHLYRNEGITGLSDKADISFHISPNTGIPIFRQLIEQVERLVACEQLKGGDLMPSVNEVSKQLAVNPMTISRAYNMLHDQGVLERQRGIGMRVSANAVKATAERLAMLDPQISELWNHAEQLGLEKQSVIDYLKDPLQYAVQIEPQDQKKDENE